ncbi:Shikimate kinase [Aquimixticola soesokkakensis]|uniref:Shikimate kinase n=1 Tax=Aquimixticola soesokkakensis TaxID=1519096 RepID=A0A1Y5SG69_9RHOB|nr:Shikimate kinase [Aquimixticola soesokkakensis]
MAWKLNRTVALVGMMGAGKTAVGMALARKLSVPFVDSDAEIEEAANRTIAEIFERDGEAFFREKEAQVISRLLDGSRVILSTGGGAFLAERNREAIAARGVAVWLKADADLLWNRVRHKTNRPLLRTENPYETLSALCTTRAPFYSKAGVIVEAETGMPIEAMAQKVLSALAAHQDILEEIPA